MPDILHKVGIKSSPTQAYKALSTLDGLSGWWTTDTTGETKPGGVIHFRFGDRGFIDMKVLELAPGKRVLWEVIDGPGEWIGTKVSFDLARDGDFTAVRFKHHGFKEAAGCVPHCATKWAMFLMSLKSYVESGSGAPYPDDVHVSYNGD